jgi:putative endonuclease
MDQKSKWYVYVLFCLKSRNLNIGFTHDLKKRLIMHSSGNVRSTKYRLPVLLIHYEYFINEADAKAGEIFLKSGYGLSQLKNILPKTYLSLKTE